MQATYTTAMRPRKKSPERASAIEAFSAKRVSRSFGAFLQALMITIVLLLITYSLFSLWRDNLVERGRQEGRAELLSIRKNIFLLMGNQEMFTALFGQRIEERLAEGANISLSELGSYLEFLEKNHPSFAFATLSRDMIVVDTYPLQAPHALGFDLTTLSHYEDHIEYTIHLKQVTLDGPLSGEGSESYLVSRYALYDGQGFRGLLSLHFDFEQVLLEAGVEDISEGYQVFFTFHHGSEEQAFQWGSGQRDQEPVGMDLSYSLMQWRMEIVPDGSWIEFPAPLILYGLISSLICLGIGVLVYLNQIKFQDIKTRSRTDSLTGLLNRREFEQVLHHTCMGDRHFAVALIDIDNFKEINDTYGHLNGDKALLCLVEMLKPHIRMSDLIARFGGDEFILLFHDCANTDFCKRLFQAVRNTRVKLEGFEFDVVISMGVAFSGEDGLYGQSLIETADHRLYQAKQQGKGRLCMSD